MIPRGVIAGALVGLSAPLAAAAGPLPADKLAPSLLAGCDAEAGAFGRYAPPIASAARALIDLGSFDRGDFSGVRIGFCGLARAGGPVAVASCTDEVILLDDKYARAGQEISLGATLAHEMKHHLQHREKKAAYGAGYCAGPRYADDKPALEAEADAFGDAIAALLLRGRAIEIVNACDVPVRFHLEAENPIAARGAAPVFEHAPPLGSALSAERALSGRIRFYAETASARGRGRFWQDRSGPHARFVEGRLIRLREFSLAPRARETGAFTLRLVCPAASRAADR